jgi:deferrochelatase/peroxidase EfeB
MCIWIRHSGAPLTGGKEFDEIDLKAKDSHGEYIIDKDAHRISINCWVAF